MESKIIWIFVIAIWIVCLSWHFAFEDPPEEKKKNEPKEQVDVQQIKKYNKSFDEQIRKLDSLIIVADSISKK